MPESLNLDELFGEAEQPQKQTEESRGKGSSGPPVAPPPGQGQYAYPPYTPQPQPTNKPSALTYLAFGVAAFFLALWIAGQRGCSLPDSDTNPQVRIKVPSPAALVLYNVQTGQASEGQKDVLATTKVQTWCEQNDVLYRKYSSEADLSKTEPYWQAMADNAKPPPSLTIANPNGTWTSVVLPDSIDKTISKIEKEAMK
jgi:hypothetical protein